MNTSKRIDIEDVLAAVYLAGTTNGLGRDITDPKEIMHRKEAFTKGNPVCKEAKSLIMELLDESKKDGFEIGYKAAGGQVIPFEVEEV